MLGSVNAYCGDRDSLVRFCDGGWSVTHPPQWRPFFMAVQKMVRMQFVCPIVCLQLFYWCSSRNKMELSSRAVQPNSLQTASSLMLQVAWVDMFCSYARSRSVRVQLYHRNNGTVEQDWHVLSVHSFQCSSHSCPSCI